MSGDPYPRYEDEINRERSDESESTLRAILKPK